METRRGVPSLNAIISVAIWERRWGGGRAGAVELFQYFGIGIGTEERNAPPKRPTPFANCDADAYSAAHCGAAAAHLPLRLSLSPY
ncbi:hypothetical protein H6P81_004330 [Aristolochia fimbriata]|uniref:Uncharacterized protein n=1 Tax=Aristolochia fimbriata TaxID=158543 RepID=A0AAV7FHJ2_ARIFI|nr:hypothetical protein H6P81_004330 [Aristolochia fimbriata]